VTDLEHATLKSLFVRMLKLNPIIYFLLVVSVIGGAIAAEQHQEQSVITLPDSSFHDITLKHATLINNSVTNMLTVGESPVSVKALIETDYRGTKHDITYSKEDIEVKTKYQEYLLSADAVANAHINKSLDLNQKIEIMNKKYNSI